MGGCQSYSVDGNTVLYCNKSEKLKDFVFMEVPRPDVGNSSFRTLKVFPRHEEGINNRKVYISSFTVGPNLSNYQESSFYEKSQIEKVVREFRGNKVVVPSFIGVDNSCDKLSSIDSLNHSLLVSQRIRRAPKNDLYFEATIVEEKDSGSVYCWHVT